MNTVCWVLQLVAVSGVQPVSPKAASAERIRSPAISIHRHTPPSTAQTVCSGQARNSSRKPPKSASERGVRSSSSITVPRAALAST